MPDKDFLTNFIQCNPIKSMDVNIGPQLIVHWLFGSLDVMFGVSVSLSILDLKLVVSTPGKTSARSPHTSAAKTNFGTSRKGFSFIFS